MMEKETLPIDAIAVVGPTASGKTSLSIELARRLHTEIISCDSMQIYRGMDIGTAKASEEERHAVPHHLIDILAPNATYSAADYGEDAYKIARSLSARAKTPIFCGGTGLYLNAACRAVHENPSVPNSDVRLRLQKISEEEDGHQILFNMLCKVDPKEAEKTHPNNLRRVIRALEIYETTGRRKSDWDEGSKSMPPRIRLLPLLLDFSCRQILYDRINRRVDAMIADGLIDEVRTLYENGAFSPESTARQAIGYKEIVLFLEGELSKEEAVESLKQATRHYAKRQLTWFRAMPDIVCIVPDRPDGSIKTSVELADGIMPTIQRFLAVANK